MMHVKEASKVLGLAPSNEGKNIAAMCKKGKVDGSVYFSAGWRVPEEWVYNRVLRKAATAMCPKCEHTPISIVPHEDNKQARIVCPCCGLDVSPKEFAEIRMMNK